MMFILVLSNTRVAEVPGISVAGENPEILKYTPPADAEFLFFDKPRCINAIPVTPQGHPTPAIITKSARNLAKFPVLVVRSGTEIAPTLPYVHITDIPGENIAEKKAINNLAQIFERSELFAEELNKVENKVMLAESIPGGTTTAQAVLSLLGYNSQVSSASIANPISLKLEIANKTKERLKNENVQITWKTVLEHAGDPMMAFMVGFARKFEGKIYLAGGTQMLAVAALLKELDKKIEKITTTKYIVNDKNSTFVKTANEININYYSAQLNFSSSKYPGLQDYEKGMVKEGVGAGGAVYLAEHKGFSTKQIADEVEKIYEKLTSNS